MDEDVSGLFAVNGKIAVITGGGGDLCSVMAKALGRAGVKTAILDLNLEKAEIVASDIIAAGGTARAYACDVLDEANLNSIDEAVRSAWGAPDILINGAGGNVPSGSTKLEFLDPELTAGSAGDFFSLDSAGVKKTFDLNYMGTFLPTKVFSKGMVAKGSGSILNMASMGALTPLTQVGAYSAAKAAVANFTAWLAVHFSRTGVRVNALAPGFFMTEQLKFLHIDQTTGRPTPRALKAMAHTPMNRYGDPEELIGGMLYLLSGASSFVTGIVLPIDGGFSSYSI
ncbi:MAG: SDR family oxidoreductase [Chlorobium sp.]|nr:SDR family oxidoreductase [Chlorobium sp.]